MSPLTLILGKSGGVGVTDVAAGGGGLETAGLAAVESERAPLVPVWAEADDTTAMLIRTIRAPVTPFEINAASWSGGRRPPGGPRLQRVATQREGSYRSRVAGKDPRYYGNVTNERRRDFRRAWAARANARLTTSR